MNKKLFVATSFSGKVDYETGKVLPEFRIEVEAILVALRAIEGLFVFCAVEHEGWRMSNDPPEIGVRNDLIEIDKADALLALLLDRPSEGVQYEMGYAAAKGKPVIVSTSADLKLGYFNQGLASLESVNHMHYSDPMMLTEQVKQFFSNH